MIVSVVSRHIKRVTFHDGGFKILPHMAKKKPVISLIFSPDPPDAKFKE